MRSILSSVAILAALFVLNAGNAYATSNGATCTGNGGTWVPAQGNDQANGVCYSGGGQGGDGGQGGNGGQGGQGQGGNGGNGGNNTTTTTNNNTAASSSSATGGTGGSVRDSGNSLNFNDADASVKNSGNSSVTDSGNSAAGAAVLIGNFSGGSYEGENEPNAPTGDVLSPKQDQGQDQKQKQAQDQGQSQGQETSVLVDSHDIFEAPKLPVNAAPASIGGSCNSGLAVSFKDVSASLGEGSIVCDLLAEARGYAAIGDIASAKTTIDEAHAETNFRRGLLRVRFILTFGLVKG